MEATKIAEKTQLSVTSSGEEADLGSINNKEIEADSQQLWEAEQSALYTQSQHELRFWPAVNLYKPAVAWSLVINIAVILSGFDGQLVGSVVGLSPFKKQFGHFDKSTGEYQVSAAWNGACNYANYVGGIVGSVLSGPVYDFAGPRITLTMCSILSIAVIFMQFFAETPVVLFLGELFNGAIISFYPVIGSAYIGEVCPLVLRGVAGSVVNLGFVCGQLIASGLLKGTNGLESKWAYKIPYGMFLPALSQHT